MSTKAVAFVTAAGLLLIGAAIYYQQNKLITEITGVAEAQAHAEHAFAEYDARTQHLLASIDENYRKLLEVPTDATFSQAKQIKAYEEQYLKKSEDIKQVMVSLDEASRNQTAILSRVIGQNIPIKIPDDIKGQLAALENRIQKSDSWPKNEAEAQALHNDLKSFVQRIPSWAEDDVIPQLTMLRWSVDIFDLSASVKHSIDELENGVTEYERLVSNMPDNVPKQLQDFAAVKLEETRKNLAQAEHEAAVKTSQDALQSGDHITDAIAQLQSYDDPAASELKKELTSLAQGKLFVDRFHLLEKSFADSKVISDPQLRQNAVTRVAEGVLELLLEAQAKGNSHIADIEALGNDCNIEINACGQTLARQQEILFAEKQRSYQQWALSQIDVFKTEFAKVSKDAKDRGYNVDGHNIKENWNDNDYKQVAFAMDKLLLPISESQLDRPVMLIYQDAFKLGWDRLASREDQTWVAKQCAIAEKKSVADMEAK